MLHAVDEFAIDLAQSSDDEAIQHLLEINHVPGRVELSSGRASSYFLGLGTMGRFYQVPVVRQRATGQILGLGYRGIQARFVNGEAEEIGYITDLLVDPRFQGRWVYARLLKMFRELHADGRATGYVGIIAGKHERLVQNVLTTSGRIGLPEVRELVGYWTLALIVRRGQRARRGRTQVARATRADVPEVVSFLQRCGRSRQFYPIYSEQDFEPGAPLTRGFQIEDLLLARSVGRIVGTMGLWDRSGFKQTVVRAYHRPYNWARPLYDFGARLMGARPLPAPGERVRCAYASFICVEDDEPEVFGSLLEQTRGLAAERGSSHLMVGLTRHDPLLPIARGFLHVPYESRLFTVQFPNEPSLHERLDGRPPCLELAAV
jgi:hypothetical protein